ncbi:MAG: ComF family protein [Leptolyngbya sp. SIOISBB]|nr:ComF family protein [Leptolyngbya sp. SIOISBB]
MQSLKSVTNLFLQQPCPLCDRPSSQSLCPACWAQVSSCTHSQHNQTAPQALPVMAWGPYEGALKRAIAALKYEQHPELAVPLGRALGKHWQQSPLTQRSPLVVPIPMFVEKQRQRGYDQAELIAQAFCTQTGLPLVRHGLMRQRATAPQFGLGVQARQQNLSGAFTLGKAFQQRPCKPVLLLDDIYTTGITVQVAASELRRCGISVCGVVTVARAWMETIRSAEPCSP